MCDVFASHSSKPINVIKIEMRKTEYTNPKILMFFINFPLEDLLGIYMFFDECIFSQG